MKSWFFSLKRLVLLAVLVFFAAQFASDGAKAQSAFCPASASGGGISTTADGAGALAQKGGNCTNGFAGAFSGAALASQALGDLATSSTELETSTTMRVISERREKEAALCPEGQERVDGICQPLQPIVPAAPVKASPRPATSRHAKTSRPAHANPPAPAPVAAQPPQTAFVDRSIHFGTWVEGYGDYERRNGSAASSMQCCSLLNVPAADVYPIPVTLVAKSTSTDGGFVGGIDVTERGFLNAEDGLILGATFGYVSSNIKVNDSILTSNAQLVGNGSSSLSGNLSGPSVGVYGTYFSGPFSYDFAIKNDFLELNENYDGTLAFGRCQCFLPAGLTFAAPFSGSGGTHLDQLTLSDNVNYKIPLSAAIWVEPTAGLQYSTSYYSGGAAALGLKDGYDLRLQGGARLGFESFLGDVRVTTSVTGLVLDDVVVHGDFVQGGAFGVNGNILNDQGVVQGEGVLALNFDFGHGLSTFAEGDIRGGAGIFGAGGKGGVRMQW